MDHRALFLLLLMICFRYSKCDITIVEDTGNSLKVAYNDVLIICHNCGDSQDEMVPLMKVGIGSFEGSEHIGNWILNDTEHSSIDLDLYSYDSSSLPSTLKIILHSSEAPDDVSFQVDLAENNDENLVVSFSYSDTSTYRINKFHYNIPAFDDEMIWGGGEQYSYLNLREGGTYPIWVREQGIGRNKSTWITRLADLLEPGSGGDYHTTYYPMASFLSSKGYHAEFIADTYSELRIAKAQKAKTHTIYWHLDPETEDDIVPPITGCSITFTVKPTLMEIVQAINPGQTLIPEWVHQGAILGVQGGTDRMLQILNQALDLGASISGLWIQDWSGKVQTPFGKRVFWNWRWNETWYPNLDNVIKDLQSSYNIRVTGYITGHLNINGDIYKQNETEPLWLKDDNGNTIIQDYGSFDVATADLSKPDEDSNCINIGRERYIDMMVKNLLDFGLSGWMADFGEYIPLEARSSCPSKFWGKQNHGRSLHQRFSQDWASVNREAVEKSGRDGDILYWMRSGGRNSKYNLGTTWAGDQTVDWSTSDGLKSSIIAASSLAVSGGVGLSHSDIGGYTTFVGIATRSKELLLRWAEYSVFTPIMRTHEGNQPEANHQVYSDEDTMRKFGRLTNIYKDLYNVRVEAVQANTNIGKPVMRPLFLDFENDFPGSYTHDYQYMFGDDLLVAPVTEPGVSQWTVYLPGNEEWIWLWNTDGKETFIGPTSVTVNATMGYPPVFYRADSKWKELFSNIAEKYAIY